MQPVPEGWNLLTVFATSLAVGLLVGIERERNPAAKAGLRTFALTALLGTVAALLQQRAGIAWLVAGGLLLVGVMMVATHARERDAQADPGTTTVVAMLLTYLYGVMIWHGRADLAVPLAIVTTSLLYFKAELRGVSQHVTRRDLISILQFGVLSMVVLPLLPDQGYGPHAALNPYQIWLMVVLISGVSLAGYLALRVAGPRHGAALVGIFGGLVSSTATTLAYSRRCRGAPELLPVAGLVVVLASTVVPLRILLLTAVSAPALVRPLAGALAPGALAGAVVAFMLWRRQAGGGGEVPVPDVANPTELRASLAFGALYGVVLLLSSWFSHAFGSSGLYGLALISGLSDVDAITLSSLRLQTLGRIGPNEAMTAIVLALAANTTLKLALSALIGGRALARRAALGLAPIALGLGTGWMFARLT